MKAGKIRISQERLLGWLQFYPLGDLRDVKFDAESQTVELLIEHPEMPEVKNGIAEEVNPIFVTHYDGEGHQVSIRQPLCSK